MSRGTLSAWSMPNIDVTSSRWSSRWLSLAVLAAVYVIAGKLGLAFAFLHVSATPLWPPTGIALAALLIGGYRLWPAIFVGAFVVNLMTAGSPATSLAIAAGNTAEAVAGAWLVRRFAGGRAAFAMPRTIFAFILGAGLAAPALSATVGVTTLALGGLAGWTAVPAIWLTWWLGDSAAALVLAPLLIVWANEPRLADLRPRAPEAVALLAVTVAAGALVFGGAVRAGAFDAPIAFLCLPSLVWAAYRFGPRGATTVLAVLAAIAAAGTLDGHGPFAVGSPNASLLLLQAFLLTMSGTVLPLAALAAELARREARSLENARLYRESEGQRRAAEAFAATSRVLAQSLDVKEVADRVVSSARELLGGTSAIVYRLDASTGDHTALAVAGDAGPDFAGAFTIPAGVGTIGLAVREGRPVVTDDVTADPRIHLTPDVATRLRRTPHRAVLAVPLVAHGHTIGAFMVGDRAGRTFTRDESTLAEAFAHHAALAIANAHLFEEARREEQELTDFFENAPVALNWVDGHGVIVRANRAELELLGYRREDYVGRAIADLHVDRAAIADLIWRLTAGQTIRGYAARLRAADGSIRHVIIDSNVQWTEGRFGHTRCFTRDVTALRAAEEAMVGLLAAERAARQEAEAARAEAEAASRAKDEFLAMLSHELRTPLTAIVGWARMLRAGNLPPAAVASGIEVIDRNAAAQAQLIEDLLDVSRIVAGTLRLSPRPVTLAPILGAAADSVRPTADGKGVRLAWSVAPGVDRVIGDVDRLQQVFWNLLANAVKFTPSGGSVTVQAVADGHEVRLSVADTGSGIDAAVLPHIFERFRQADSSMTRQHGGLGLGLALVKHIVELHGGTVRAESGGPGRGATFTVTLPRAEGGGAADVAVPRAVPREGSADLAGHTVLVVEDERDAREFCERALASHGAAVTTADSVGQALECLGAVKPDVVVADLAMPGEDGFDLIRRLRARESGRGPRAVVVALTAYASEQDRRRVLEAGFDVHVAKPFDPEELVATIRAFLTAV